MTSLVFKSLLALSLAGNASLGFALWGPTLVAQRPTKAPPAMVTIGARAAEPSTDVSPSFTSRPPVASEADRALILEAAARYGRTPALGDPRTVAEKMFREGYPDDVVANVVGSLIDEWLGQKAMDKAARAGNATARRLRKIGTGGGPLQKYMQDLFPQWREEAERTKAHERHLRFGAMPLEKILAIERLEQEFDPSGGLSRQSNDYRGRVDEAKLREALERVLTPEELADYFRFNSIVARNLQHQLSSIEIDEETYARLLEIATARGGGPGQFTFISDYRGVLSDEQFVQLIPKGGNPAAQADGFYRAAGLSDNQRAEFFVLAQAVLENRNPSRQPAAAIAALERIRTALTVSPENAARFEASPLAAAFKRAAQNP